MLENIILKNKVADTVQICLISHNIDASALINYYNQKLLHFIKKYSIINIDTKYLENFLDMSK